MGDFIYLVNDYVWNFFYTTIEQWNNWIAHLEQENYERERQVVVTTETKQPHRTKYYEENFLFNLDGKKPQLTLDPQANEFITAFETLNIDIFRLLKNDRTLPDEAFLSKRYRNIQRNVHPDNKTGSQEKSIQVNVAKDRIDHLYSSITMQITLLEAVFTTTTTTQQQNSTEEGTSSYVLLYLVGLD
jgi:hypothetical protein